MKGNREWEWKGMGIGKYWEWEHIFGWHENGNRNGIETYWNDGEAWGS